MSEVQNSITPITLWLRSEVGHNQDAKQEVKPFNPDDVFATPKPERLIERVLQLATNPGDLVLDSFLGSGTTAVAHKMGRRWIGIEMVEHAQTHCAPRLRAVVNGADSGGITEAAHCIPLAARFAELENGKVLVAEYKGENRRLSDEIKDQCGKMLEQTSQGKAFFLMTTEEKGSGKPPVDQQISAKIAGIMQGK